jgi:branched-chain amino acid transport system ATP-binding protein
MSLLSIDHLNKAFGGLQATNDVSLSLHPGELSAIIGSNGAGKSTLFNLITGYHRPDSGRVVFDNRDLAGLRPHEIVRLGIGRSFQRSNIFPRLTVFENVQTAVLSQHRQSGHLWKGASRFSALNEQVVRILESVGLWEKRDRLGGKLALGDQKRLEMGLALALEPKLLLLDEPTAGMSPEETHSTVALVKQIADEFKVTLLFTEHDMAVVFGIAQSIYVL